MVVQALIHVCMSVFNEVCMYIHVHVYTVNVYYSAVTQLVLITRGNSLMICQDCLECTTVTDLKTQVSK